MHLQLATAPRCRRVGAADVPLAPRDAALLAWLAIEGPTSRARVVQLLWPDKDAEVARNVLRQRLFQLHKRVEKELVAGSVTLCLAGDVTHDLDDADSLLGEAVGDDLAPGEFAQWLALQRGRRQARVRGALVELAGMAEGAHDWGDALAHAHELLALDPLSEDAHRRVIRLHYLAGDRAAALLAFDRCEQLLKHEVGARPSAETLALLALIERAAPAAVSPPGSARAPPRVRPPRPMGRDPERQALAQAIQSAAIVWLVGEAGMGKSRLIADAIETAAPSIITVGARPGDAAVPYAVAARWLRALLQVPGVEPSAAQRGDLARVLPELGSATARAGAEERARLHSTLQALLECAVQQGLRAVIVDDLQFADPPSVELLHPLVGAAACAWIVAMRPHELGPAARALVDAHAASAQAVTLDLQPLDVPAIAALLDTLAIEGIGGPAQAASLHQRTGGNPLYLLETLKLALSSPGTAGLLALSQRGPGGVAPDRASAVAWPRADSVQRLIQQRLLRLSPLALKLARCAALAGQDLSPPLAAEVLGLRPLDLADAWAELETAQVLRDGAFAHDLIAEAALALVPQAIARSLHAEIAAFVDRSAGEPARIAAHWIAAGEPRKAVPHLSQAAHRAQAAWQRGQAADLHEQAAAILLDAGDRRGAFDAYFAAAEAASQMTGRGRLAEFGQALLHLADDDGQRAAASLVPTFLLHESGQIDAARTLVLEALPRAQRAGAADIEVELLWFLTLFHCDRVELPDAMRRAEQALDRLAAIDPATARLKHLGTRFKLTSALGSILSSTGHYAQGDAKLLEALQQARRDREWAHTDSIIKSLAVNALEQGSLERALDWSAQALADGERYDGGEHGRVLVATLRTVMLALNADLGGALITIERALDICGSVALRVEPHARRALHHLQFELGRSDLALKGLRSMRTREHLPAPERIALDAELLHAGERLDSDALLEQIVALDDFALRVRLLCLAQPGCAPLRILPLLGLSAAAARDQGAHGLWLTLQTRRVAALRLAGRTAEAQQQALVVWQRVEDGISGFETVPRIAAEMCAALADSHPDLVQTIALRASAWMQTAAASLPTEWRQNYLMRAPVLQVLPPAARGLLMMARPDAAPTLA